MARTMEQSVLDAVCGSPDVKLSLPLSNLIGCYGHWASLLPARQALDRDSRNRCAKCCHRHPILQKRSQETFDKVRIALFYVAHEVLHLARRRASGVLERYRDLGPSGVSQIFGEDTTTNYHERQRPDRTKQAAQEADAPLEIELAERA